MKVLLTLLILAQITAVPVEGLGPVNQLLWYQDLLKQPGGINPMPPPDSTSGRISLYA